jgi:DNA-binding NarL/FixJ family response regulator
MVYSGDAKHESGAVYSNKRGKVEQMSTEVEQQQQQQQQPKQQQLEWRRDRVLELSSQGRTEREIAQILKVGTGTIHRDIVYLNKQAQENLKRVKWIT